VAEKAVAEKGKTGAANAVIVLIDSAVKFIN
jgi:hypothetical protein